MSRRTNRTVVDPDTAPDVMARIAEAQRRMFLLFAELDLTCEEGLSAMTWMTARILYQEARADLDLVGSMHDALTAALRTIEQRERKGRFPLA
jgi:hypothetical protein